MSRKRLPKEVDVPNEDYDSLAKDVIGDDGNSDEEESYEYGGKDKSKGRQRRGQEEEDKIPDYMFFDFRRGKEFWPTNVEIVDPKRCEDLLAKATAAAEEAAKLKKKENDDDENKKDSGTSVGFSSDYSYTAGGDDDAEGEENGANHPDVSFEVLKDGSTALVIKPGCRLKIKLNDLLNGGDEKKEEREKKARNLKKKMASYGVNDPWAMTGDYDIWAGSSSKWFKEYINEYTITMDIKLMESPPRDGIALYQTALIHAKENKRSGKTTFTRSDGECLVNQLGGVGIFGTFGDTTKAKLEVGIWKRVVIAVKCVEGKNEKGELRTWIGTEAGVVLREESLTANERFALDPDNLFLFSSSQSAMMPGNIAIRTLRVEKYFATDEDVKSGRARDKVSRKGSYFIFLLLPNTYYNSLLLMID